MSFRSKRKASVFAAVLAAAAVVLILYLLSLALLRIRGIEITGNSLYTADEIKEASGISEGDYLPFVRRSRVAENIKSRLGFVSSVNVRFRGFDTAVISVSEQNTVFFSVIGDFRIGLSKDLRVTETDCDGSGIEIEFPAIKRAYIGEMPELYTGDPEHCRTFVSALIGAFGLDSIGSVSVKDADGFHAVVNGGYKLMFGGINDLNVKIEVAKKMLANEQVSAMGAAEINLVNPKEVYVLPVK